MTQFHRDAYLKGRKVGKDCDVAMMSFEISIGSRFLFMTYLMKMVELVGYGHYLLTKRIYLSCFRAVVANK